ncbi:sterile alpha motif domain-containing protein 15 [Desmodus rotundus]|uniref:sterile alpha motif domain-containing protein 15 n=1 Tax=Desmodus rotundus TaxID=9430 RepID=UPI002380D5F6|nr:sterile alpha motif domain-containing protein 15 [Desmodus rotundus]
MGEVPGDYDSGPDENEDLGSERPQLPVLLKRAEHAEPDVRAEAVPELPEEMDPEPQPETEEENFKDLAPESTKNTHPHQNPSGTPEEESPKESEIDISSKTKTGIPEEVTLETSGGMVEEFFKDLEVPMDEKQEEPDLGPPEEATPDVTEDVFIESAKEIDLELPKAAESEVPRATINETGLESVEETEPGVPEELLREQTEESSLEPPEQTKPDFPSEKPRKSIEEAVLQPQGVTTPEFAEQTERESPEEERTEPSEQTILEFAEEKARKSTEEAGLQSPEDTKPGGSGETRRKPSEEEGTEQTEQEFPDQKLSKYAEETGAKPTEGKVPEPLEETKSGFPEEESRKPIEEIGLELSGENKSEIQEEIQRKSAVEKVLEPPEDTEPTVQEDKQRISAKTTGLAPPQKSKSEDTLRESAEEKGLGPPEQTAPELAKDEPKTRSRSTEDTGQVPPQKTQPEVQEKTRAGPTKDQDLPDRDLESPDEAKSLHREETYKEFAKEDRSEPIKLKRFVEKDKLQDSDYETLLVKETKQVVKDSVLESPEVGDVSPENADYMFSEESSELYDISYELYPSEFQRDLRNSLKLNKLVCEEEERQPKERIELQFECLKWGPEKVAEWISELGFPQYKECFTTNFINGRKLIHVNCSNLPQMGITDFEDMKVISRHTRELLGIEEPLFNRSISLPYRDNIGLFLERKGHTGVKSDSLTLSEFVETAGLQDYEP